MPMTLTSSMDPSLLCSRSKRVWLIEAVNLPEVRGKGPSHHSRDHQGHPCPPRPRSRRAGLDGADELSAGTRGPPVCASGERSHARPPKHGRALRATPTTRHCPPPHPPPP